MTYALISSWNMTGLDALFCYTNYISAGIFIPVFLAVVWLIFLFGSYFMQKWNTGFGDFPASLGISGFVIAVFTILMRLQSCLPNIASQLVDGYTTAVFIVIAVFSVAIFFFSQD